MSFKLCAKVIALGSRVNPVMLKITRYVLLLFSFVHIFSCITASVIRHEQSMGEDVELWLGTFSGTSLRAWGTEEKASLNEEYQWSTYVYPLHSQIWV